MKDMEGALLGFLVAAAGWIGLNLIGKPLLAIRETRTNISKALVQYEKDDTAVAAVTTIRLTPPAVKRLDAGDDPTEDGRKTYLQLASALISNLNAIPFYGFWSLTGVLPSHDNIQIAYSNLIGLSTMSGRPGGPDNIRRRANIRSALRLKL